MPDEREGVQREGAQMASKDDRKKTLKDDDFPVKADKDQIKTRDGDKIADANDEQTAEEIVERLNDDAWRRHEDNWSA